MSLAGLRTLQGPVSERSSMRWGWRVDRGLVLEGFESQKNKPAFKRREAIGRI